MCAGALGVNVDGLEGGEVVAYGGEVDTLAAAVHEVDVVHECSSR